MANEEHFEILKQGTEVWNKWRKHHKVIPDLSYIRFIDQDVSKANLTNADLSYSNLSKVNLRRANLGEATLYAANFSEVNLSEAYLNRANLNCVNLTRALMKDASLSLVDLRWANLSYASLIGAIFYGANLFQADLLGANLINVTLTEANCSSTKLRGTDLRGAKLIRTNLANADLNGANLTGAVMAGTILTGMNLALVEGLNSVRHNAPSAVDIETLRMSSSNLPEKFLQRCGMSDEFIVYLPSLLGAENVIKFYSCFISYSSRNEYFVKRLYSDLENAGIRCWYAPEDLRIGEKIRVSIDESIKLHDKLLLVLSKASVGSRWVEKEVETALEQEERQGRIILFPIRLDNTVMEIEDGWPADIRRTRNIGDFTHWKKRAAYQAALLRLLHDLKSPVSLPHPPNNSFNRSAG